MMFEKVCPNCRQHFEAARARRKYCSYKCSNGAKGKADAKYGHGHFDEHVLKTETCWIWLGKRDKGGYGKLCEGGIYRRAHIYSWERTHGPTGGLHVLHRCDNPACVNPSHLFLGTIADNNADRKAKMRSAWGERNPQARLSVDQVLSIRRSGESHVALARKHGVDRNTIMRIRSRRSWAHLTEAAQ